MPSGDLQGKFTLRHVVSQAGWAGAFELLGTLVRYVLAVLVARLFGAEGLGLYTLAIAFASAAALVSRVGLDRTIMRFTPYHRAQQDLQAVVGVAWAASGITATLSLLVAATLALAAGTIERTWQLPGLADGVRIMSLAVPAIALGEVWRYGLRGFQDVRFAAFLEKLVIPGSAAIIVLAGGMLGFRDARIAIVASAAAYVLAAMGAGLSLRRAVTSLHAIPRWHLRAWVSFGLFLSLEGGLLYLLHWTDQLLVGLFLDATQVGIYAAAVRVALLTSVPLMAVNTILGPTLAGFHGAGDRERLRLTYSRLTWATAAAGVAVGLTLLAIGPFVLSLFGDEFASGYAALAIVTLGQMVNAGTGSAGLVLGMTGHVRWRLINAALAAILNVALNLLLIPLLGIVGSGIATAASLVAINLLQIAEVRWLLGFWGYDPRQLAFWIDRVRRTRSRSATR